jgi:hypothetical protein
LGTSKDTSAWWNAQGIGVAKRPEFKQDFITSNLPAHLDFIEWLGFAVCE